MAAMPRTTNIVPRKAIIPSLARAPNIDVELCLHSLLDTEGKEAVAASAGLMNYIEVHKTKDDLVTRCSFMYYVSLYACFRASLTFFSTSLHGCKHTLHPTRSFSSPVGQSTSASCKCSTWQITSTLTCRLCTLYKFSHRMIIQVCLSESQLLEAQFNFHGETVLMAELCHKQQCCRLANRRRDCHF